MVRIVEDGVGIDFVGDEVQVVGGAEACYGEEGCGGLLRGSRSQHFGCDVLWLRLGLNINLRSIYRGDYVDYFSNGQ